LNISSIPAIVLFDPTGNEVERLVGVPRVKRSPGSSTRPLPPPPSDPDPGHGAARILIFAPRSGSDGQLHAVVHLLQMRTDVSLEHRFHHAHPRADG